jgi:hypothetical protein
VAFAWTPGSVATHFELWVGSYGPGTSDLYNSENITGTTTTVNNLPNNDEIVYVRLWYLIGQTWHEIDYTYTASGTAILPAITSPVPSTTLPGTSAAFQWSTGNIATEYQLWVGTGGVGATNIYDSGHVTVTTETVTGLPNNGGTVNVRLMYMVNGGWESTDYTYTATGTMTPAALTTPTPDTSTPLSGTSVAFAWTPGNIATHFELWVGTTSPGSSNLYYSNNVTVTTETVSDLPSNGEKVYVRLYWLIGSTWHEADYTYVAYGSPTQAVLTTPTPDTPTPLTGTSVAFSWTPSNIVTQYQFRVGTSDGSTNLYNSGPVTATTETVSDLPSNGETVYARLYTLMDDAWKYTDYTYKATGSPIAAALTTPTPDTTTPLTSTSVAFSWTPGNLATQFKLYVGSTVTGSSNLYNSGPVTVTTETVSDLPDNDSRFYVRLYSLINGGWQYTDYTYISAGTATQGTLTTPTPDTSTPLTSTSVAFAWTPGNSATHFMLYVGPSIGSSSLYNSGNVTATTETVSDLPSNGQTFYVRLYSLVNGAWPYTDYTYVASGSPTQAVLTTPTPNTSTPLSGSSVTFSWTPGNTATLFMLYLGTSVGSSSLYNSGKVTATSETVNNLPTNGETIYARLYSLIDGVWEYTNYTYVAF